MADKEIILQDLTGLEIEISMKAIKIETSFKPVFKYQNPVCKKQY